MFYHSYIRDIEASYLIFYSLYRALYRPFLASRQTYVQPKRGCRGMLRHIQLLGWYLRSLELQPTIQNK